VLSRRRPGRAAAGTHAAPKPRLAAALPQKTLTLARRSRTVPTFGGKSARVKYRALRLRALLRRSLFLAAALFTAAAPAARASDPIMPLAEVHAGMHCTGLSVIRGTEISSFDVEVLDVIAQEAGLSGPRILVRASGPAVDASGIGQGFSGSPILCDGRNAGAISEGLGDYGNHVVLATPIEEILSDRPARSARARRNARLARAARPLVGPLTISGLSARTRELVTRAAGRAGLTVLAAPAAPAAGYAPVDLRPGAAVGVAVSTGDLAVGGVGTVAYRDGDSVWAFGHALDGLGRRSLFLQDSYVFGVISNPLGIAPALSYKIATSAGNVLGSVTSDTFASVAGTIGAEPPSVPLKVVARGEGAKRVVLESRLADERALGYGAGLSVVAPLAASQALEGLTRSVGPVTFSICLRFRVRELRRAMGFCNPYFAVDRAMADLREAGDLVDSFDLAPLHIEGAELRVHARPGVTEDVLVDADAPRRVRPGQRVPLRLAVQRRRGGRRAISGSLRVPGSLRPGRHTILLAGQGQRFSSEEALMGEFEAIVIEIVDEGDGEPEARSPRELAHALRRIHRPLGIEARLKRRRLGLVVRSSDVSYAGSVPLTLRVLRRRG
jgi:SpoIVB peptidase S55